MSLTTRCTRIHQEVLYLVTTFSITYDQALDLYKLGQTEELIASVDSNTDGMTDAMANLEQTIK